MKTEESKLNPETVLPTNIEKAHKSASELLALINTIVEDDFRKLEAAIMPKYLERFQSLPEERRILLALIHKLPDEKFREVFMTILKANIDESDIHYVGLHNIGASVGWLINHTNDPKYDFIRNKEHRKEQI